MTKTPTPDSPSVVMLPDGRMDSHNGSLYAGYADKTMAMKRVDGTGPEFVKVGGKVYYFKDAIDAWIKAGRRTRTLGKRRAP